MSNSIVVNGISIVIGGNEEIIEGTVASEMILGTSADDTINALAGNDLVQGGLGADTINGEEGDDGLIGGEGDDIIDGGLGSDVMRGDEGADMFLFDPSAGGGEDDVITDFTFGQGDVIGLSAAGLSSVAPDLEEFSGAALDASEDFTISASEEDENGEPAGDVVITHPGGTITLVGVPFSDSISFAGLESAGFLEIQGLLEGSGTLEGTEEADLIVASGAATIIGNGGDDTLTGSEESDIFAFDPSTEEGDDVITNFQLSTDTTEGDFIGLSSAQVLAADPDLPSSDGDGSSLTVEDFRASSNWFVSEADSGNLLLNHPGGTIELQGVAFEDQIFNDLAPFLLVDGEPIPEEGIPVADSGDGTDDDDDDDGTDDDGTDDDGTDDDGTDDDGTDDDGTDDDGTDDDGVVDDDDDIEGDDTGGDGTDDDEVVDDDDDIEGDDTGGDDTGDDIVDDTDDTVDDAGDDVVDGTDDIVDDADDFDLSSLGDSDDAGDGEFDFASLDSGPVATDDGASGGDFSFISDMPDFSSFFGNSDVDIA